MTHEELRALLPRYAAGELEPAGERSLQEHLASGCSDCLEELFRHPVGLPVAVGRDDLETRHTVPADGRPRRASGRGRLGIALVVMLGLGVAALVTWVVVDLRRREASARIDVTQATQRLVARAAESSAQAERIAALERELAATREQLARDADSAAQTAASLRQNVEATGDRVAALLRDVQQRDEELDRLRMSAEEQRTVRELLATPGIEVLPLAAVGPYRDVSGHVLWHPARPVLVLYAFGLPALPAGSEYRVRLRVDGSAPVAAASIRPGPDGAVALPVRLTTAGAKLREVLLMHTPPAQTVLAGRVPADRTPARGVSRDDDF